MPGSVHIRRPSLDPSGGEDITLDDVKSRLSTGIQDGDKYDDLDEEFELSEAARLTDAPEVPEAPQRTVVPAVIMIRELTLGLADKQLYGYVQ